MKPGQLEKIMSEITEEALLGAIARGWCSLENEKKTMDSDLVSAISKEVIKTLQEFALWPCKQPGKSQGDK